MEIAKKNRWGAVEVRIEGMLDADSIQSFERFIKSRALSSDKSVIGINTIGLRGIDSTGLSTLIKMVNLCNNEKKKLILYGMNPSIWEALSSHSRLDTLLNFMQKDEFEMLYPNDGSLEETF